MTVEKGISEEEVKIWFNTDPQYAVEQIRERGRRLYGHKQNIEPVIR
jgi:hypothetical protein